MKYVCSRCGKEEDAATRKPRCECGGLWDLEFGRPKFSLDLVDRDEWSIFRYRAFMPPLGENWKAVSLGEGLTPVVRFDDDLSLKMDYFMPTLSFKDRGAAVLVSHCRAIGVRSVAQDSSGNAGNSVAAYCARAGIACEIFVPEGTSPKKIDMIRAHGARAHVVPGSRDHCADVCRAAVRERGLYYANHVYNPFFYEGTKTYLYEIYEQLGRVPRNIFVPVGNGTLYLGVVKALEEFLAAGIVAAMPNVVLTARRCWKRGAAATRNRRGSIPAPRWPRASPSDSRCAARPSSLRCASTISRSSPCPRTRSSPAAANWPRKAFTASTRRPPTTPATAATASSTAARPTASSLCAARG